MQFGLGASALEKLKDVDLTGITEIYSMSLKINNGTENTSPDIVITAPANRSIFLIAIP